MGNYFTFRILTSPHVNDVALYKGMDLLEDNMRRKVEAIIADAKGNGHSIVVLETYRSKQRQTQLFEEGKTHLKTVGVHHYGLACDLAFLAPDGSINWNADYSVLGHLAEAHQLVWGGNWHMKDMGHVQWCKLEDQPALFEGTWYPPHDGNYNPLD